jgi:hypothetical protein
MKAGRGTMKLKESGTMNEKQVVSSSSFRVPPSSFNVRRFAFIVSPSSFRQFDLTGNFA